MTKKTIKTGSNNQEIRIAFLRNGYIRHQLTEKEHDELDEWVCPSFTNQRVFETITDGLMDYKENSDAYGS